jgi:hypothetical protein
MTTNQFEVRNGGRASGQRFGASADGAVGPDRDPRRGPSLVLPFGTTDGWTQAHTEAARFIGECFACGALCGLVVEMARPMRGRRHG